MLKTSLYKYLCTHTSRDIFVQQSDSYFPKKGTKWEKPKISAFLATFSQGWKNQASCKLHIFFFIGIHSCFRVTQKLRMSMFNCILAFEALVDSNKFKFFRNALCSEMRFPPSLTQKKMHHRTNKNLVKTTKVLLF